LSTVYISLQEYLLAYETGNKNVEEHAKNFCDPYFADLNSYTYSSKHISWLAFPFPGLLQKRALNMVPKEVQTLFKGNSEEGVLLFANGIPDISILPHKMKKIHLVGPGYSQHVGSKLIIDSAFGLTPVEGINGEGVGSASDIGIKINEIKRGLYDGAFLNRTRIPVAIYVNYMDDPLFFDNFVIDEKSIIFLFVFTAEAPLDVTRVASLPSSDNIVVLDLVNDHPYENLMGDSFAYEKDASDIIAFLQGSRDLVNAASTMSVQLLDTFAISGVLISGKDYGGSFEQARGIGELKQLDLSVGLMPSSFAFDLQTDIQTFDGVGAEGDVELGYSKLPDTLDWRALRPQCMTPVVNQKSCNNCWAIGTMDSMNSRLCIQEALDSSFFMSIYHTTACAVSNGCAPQRVETAFSFALGDIHTAKCMPRIPTTSSNPTCFTGCDGNERLDVVNGVESGSYTWIRGTDALKRALVDGPVAVAFSVTKEFMRAYGENVRNVEVYDPQSLGTFLGYHLMSCYGWIMKDNKEVWIVKNSWGAGSGDGGYIYIKTRNPLYTGGPLWPDTHAYTANARAGTSNPSKLSTQIAQTVQVNSATVETQTKERVYTNPYGCPCKTILNTNQSNKCADTRGCPINIKKQKKKKQNATAEN
jgi:hypothetical protein